MSETTKRLGEVGFNGYGNSPGIAGPWKTFDGREMPRYGALAGEAGELTKQRWEAAAVAILNHARPFLLRGEAPPEYQWDEFAKTYRALNPGLGRAISPRTTGA